MSRPRNLDRRTPRVEARADAPGIDGGVGTVRGIRARPGPRAPGVASVDQIMQRRIITISAGERLSTVEDIMTLAAVRHMPVVSGGALVGVLSERDLLRASLSNIHCFGDEVRRAFLHGVEIAHVMSKPPIVISPSAPVREAARIMGERKIGCLPVTDDAGRLVGLVTETDLLRHFAGLEPDLEA